MPDYTHKCCSSCQLAIEFNTIKKKIGCQTIIDRKVYCFAVKGWVKERFRRDNCDCWNKPPSSFTSESSPEPIILVKMNPNGYLIEKDIEESEGL